MNCVFEIGPGGALGFDAIACRLAETEFQARAGFSGDPSPGMLMQSADQVAEAGYRGLQQGARLVVPGFGNRMATAIMRFLPRRLLLDSVGRYNRKRIQPG